MAGINPAMTKERLFPDFHPSVVVELFQQSSHYDALTSI
jgi:hypothetical protein